MIRAVAAHLRDRTLRGILIVLPLLITIWLVKVLFGLVSDNATPIVLAMLEAAGLEGTRAAVTKFVAPLIGFALTLLLIYLIGLLAANLVGRRLLDLFERAVLRVPVVKSIYGGSRQLLDALDAGKAGGFSSVVLVEYPRRGLWTVGFVTGESPALLPSESGSRAGTTLIFLPTTPNPTSGWLVLAASNDVIDVDISVEEGIKLIVSGGMIQPSDFEGRIRGPRAAPPELRGGH